MMTTADRPNRGASAKAALLTALVDDASLFPPAELPMAAALRAHARNRESAYASLQGRFVVPASRLGAWRAERDPLFAMRLSVICDGALAGDLAAIAALIAQPLLTIDSLELRASAPFDPAPFADAWPNADLAIWIEAPFDGGWPTPPAVTLAAIANMRAAAPASVRIGAKVRCGGLQANLFPTPADLAAFIIAADARRIPWKATAGLHHPVRHVRNGTNFRMHGFLNVAVAAIARHAGVASDDDVQAILAEEDARAFALDPAHVQWRSLRVDAAAIVSAREESFCSYGSCSFFEPVDDLRRLGMLA